MTARVTLFAGPDQAVEQVVTVAAVRDATVDAAAITAPYVSAMVEIDGGGGVVEQRAQRPVRGLESASPSRRAPPRPPTSGTSPRASRPAAPSSSSS